jgi:hypothetical protein
VRSALRVDHGLNQLFLDGVGRSVRYLLFFVEFEIGFHLGFRHDHDLLGDSMTDAVESRYVFAFGRARAGAFLGVGLVGC